MASSTQPKQHPVVQMEKWNQKLQAVSINKHDLNKLIMNYLVIEGYKDAAEKFSIESGLSAGPNLTSIQDRMNIRNAIQAGKVEEAIERVNDLDPEILDTNPQLYFHLQQQRLIELIRSGQMESAIEFAQEELAPRGEENTDFLKDLETTMALLAFDNNITSPVQHLLDHSHRQKTASELNSAILTAQSQEKDPKLPSLLKLLVWSQKELEDLLVFPRIKDLLSAELEMSSEVPNTTKDKDTMSTPSSAVASGPGHPEPATSASD